MSFGGRPSPAEQPRPVRDLRQLVHKDLESFDSLPAGDGPDRARLRADVLHASLRWRNARVNVASENKALAIFLCVGGGLGSWVLIAPLWVDKADGRHRAALSATVLIASLVIALVAAIATSFAVRRRRTSPPEALAADVVIPVCSLAVAFSLRDVTPRGVASLGAFGWSAGCCIWISVWLGGLISDVITNRVIVRRCLAFDALLVDVVHLAADLHRSSRWRLSARSARLACDRLESLAAVSEKAMTAPGRAPRRVRAELRQDGLRLAAVFRSYQKQVATAHTVADVDRIVAALLAAAEALAAGDRETLLEHAPDSVPVVRRLYRVLVRTWPPLVMIASGVALPFIPPLADQPGAAGSVRWSLIVAGVLTLVAGRDTAGHVGGTLDKALSWKK
ncbi:hypothetical protein [Streptomyces sp. NPDC017202]|uniref:hypothetical protein n=1 Tax=Streptomyces sp. NPDC017202 TaxID=3364981 RepID=UPI00378DBE9C